MIEGWASNSWNSSSRITYFARSGQGGILIVNILPYFLEKERQRSGDVVLYKMPRTEKYEYGMLIRVHEPSYVQCINRVALVTQFMTSSGEIINLFQSIFSDLYPAYPTFLEG